jgi:hypothetical protein
MSLLSELVLLLSLIRRNGPNESGKRFVCGVVDWF